MNAIHYIKLLLKYITWLLLVPIVCALTVALLTRNTQKQYTSTTTLYTGVASGYSITSTEDERLDYFAVNNAFDNLMASAKSRETLEQVALHLLAEHLTLKKTDSHVLSQAGYENLRKLVGPEILNRVKGIADTQRIYSLIDAIYTSKADNTIANILNKPGSFYSIDDLKSNLVVTRLNTSDILQVVYTCTDAAVCLRTLQLHSSVFTANYKRLKSDQTFSAVQYFETKLAEAKTKLQQSEDELKVFGQKNRIINYYEQTRYIAESKEQLDKEIYAQKVSQKGSRQALTTVEKKLHSRNQQIDNSLNVISLRQRLSQVRADLDKAQVFKNANKVTEYSKQAQLLEDSLKGASNQYLNLNYTLETVPRSNLIQEWVDNTVTDEKATAGINVLNNQKQNYLKQFDEFAPLGSTLKRLDRQVDINEKEFLSILHGLNLARLRQSNLALNSNIVIQDKPFFPLRALPSTRALLIILSFFVGFILVASVVISRELMDSSLRSPERAKKTIGLPLAGISITNSTGIESAYRQPLRMLLMEKMISNILPFISTEMETDGKAQISLICTKADIYNPIDIQLLNEALNAIFSGVFWVVPETCSAVFSTGLPQSCYYTYAPSIQQLNYKDVRQFNPDAIPQKGVVIYVSPNLSLNSLPLAVARLSGLAMLAFNSKHTWGDADKEVLVKIAAALPNVPMFSWLVNTDEANLDNSIGEIPKKRSWLRRKIKKMITLNLR